MEGKEMLQAPEQRFPCSPWWRPWWGSLSPCSPCRSTVEHMSTCSPWRTPCQSRWMHPKEAVTLWGAPCCGRLLPGPVDPWREEPTLEQVCWQGLWPHGGLTLEQSVPEGLQTVGRTHAGVVREELQPVGRTPVGEVCGELSPMRGTSGAGAECEESSPWGTRSGRNKVGWTDRNPHFPSPCTAPGEELERIRSEVKPVKKEGRFVFCSHYPTLIWLVIN